MKINPSLGYDQAQIAAGKAIWDQLAQSLKGGERVEMAQAEHQALWAYNDSLHRDGYEGITPERFFQASFVVVAEEPKQEPAKPWWKFW